MPHKLRPPARLTSDDSTRLAAISPERQAEALRQARLVFQRAGDWTEFYRRTLGAHGLLRRLFPDPDELAAFQRTEQFQQIQRMLLQLQQRRGAPVRRERRRVITVRLPESLHEALKAEAAKRGATLNQLCVAKLCRLLDDDGGQPVAARQTGREGQDGQARAACVPPGRRPTGLRTPK